LNDIRHGTPSVPGLKIKQTYLKVFLEIAYRESDKLRIALWNSASGEQLDLGRVGIPRGENLYWSLSVEHFNGKALIIDQYPV